MFRFLESLFAAEPRATYRARLGCEQLGERVMPDGTVNDGPQPPVMPPLPPGQPPVMPPGQQPPPPAGQQPPPPQLPPLPKPKPPSFGSISEIVNGVIPNADADALLKKFTDAGGTVVGGETIAAGGAQIAFYPDGKPPIITIDPNKTYDKSDAIASLVYELVRYDNRADRQANDADPKAGRVTAEQYTDKYERYTYEYITKQQEIPKKPGITLVTNRLGDVISKFPTYDKFLQHEKDTGHYDQKLKYAQSISSPPEQD